MFENVGAEQVIRLTLYTDAYVVRCALQTRQRRLIDVLNSAEEGFLVVTDVAFEEFGTHGQTVKAEFAQLNLPSVLFAVAESELEPLPDLRAVKIAEHAMVSIPPFRLVGRIHLAPERDLRLALGQLTDRFVPLTEVTYWSDSVGEPKTQAPMVAVNHARAQILAPHREVDPWAGLDRSAGAGEGAEAPATRAGPLSRRVGGFDQN